MVILSDGGDNGSRKIGRTGHRAGAAWRHPDLLHPVQRMGRRERLWDLSSSGRGQRKSSPAKAVGEHGRSRLYRFSRSMSLREIFAEIGQDLRLQYEVGYTPPSWPIQPNSYHKLELRAKDKKLSVQARKGFFAQP